MNSRKLLSSFADVFAFIGENEIGKEPLTLPDASAGGFYMGLVFSDKHPTEIRALRREMERMLGEMKNKPASEIAANTRDLIDSVVVDAS